MIFFPFKRKTLTTFTNKGIKSALWWNCIKNNEADKKSFYYFNEFKSWKHYWDEQCVHCPHPMSPCFKNYSGWELFCYIRQKPQNMPSRQNIKLTPNPHPFQNWDHYSKEHPWKQHLQDTKLAHMQRSSLCLQCHPKIPLSTFNPCPKKFMILYVLYLNQPFTSIGISKFI